jgi:hypothetical protein
MHDPAWDHAGEAIQIDPALLEQFGRRREYFASGSIPFRKAYLRSLIEVIEVDDKSVLKATKTYSKERSWPAGMGPFRARRCLGGIEPLSLERKASVPPWNISGGRW